MDPILSHVLAAAVGALVGAGLVYLLVSGGKGKNSAKAVRAEFDEYREQEGFQVLRSPDAAERERIDDTFRNARDWISRHAEERFFRDAIREGVRPPTDGRSGLEVVRVLEAAQESMRKNGERVFLEPAR